ncbi:MAG: polysaccharide biosynthesis/export family protein [Isosphaeraceae bacterium]|nr:polysaccharide biosynthesis/export family protein [Isosphaeraceae bacterium]
MLPARGQIPGLAALLALAGALTGCSVMGSHREKKIPQYGVVDPTLPHELKMVSQPPYVIEPPDELEISVLPTTLEVPLTTLTVQPDGTLDFGFLGDVYVAGLTLAEAERKIALHLMPLAQQKRIREPIQVSVRNVTPRLDTSKRYYVIGTVTTQGSFPILGNETVLDGILAAGLRSNSLPEKSYLVRPHPDGGPPQVFAIDWFGITQRGDTTTNYQLFPGDRIYVPGGKPPGLLSTLLGGG